VFWVISVYFNIRYTLPKSGTFLLGHPIYIYIRTLNSLEDNLKMASRGRNMQLSSIVIKTS